ncbi:hypothetical protein HAX54_008449, partial [Datura stramonium]|nr:hypothetical protein [Datura stramonium]
SCLLEQRGSRPGATGSDGFHAVAMWARDAPVLIDLYRRRRLLGFRTHEGEPTERLVTRRCGWELRGSEGRNKRLSETLSDPNRDEEITYPICGCCGKHHRGSAWRVQMFSFIVAFITWPQGLRLPAGEMVKGCASNPPVGSKSPIPSGTCCRASGGQPRD